MLSWIEINAEALTHNFRLFQEMAAPAIAAPVLKSNAYGHGLREVLKALSIASPPWICVNYLSEANLLRSFGFKGRVLVVGPAVTTDWDSARRAMADIVLGNWEVLRSWVALDAPCVIHLKFDTGMSRQGFSVDEVSDVANYLVGQSVKVQASVVGVCTHFANVEDVTDHSFASVQMAGFESVAQHLEGRGFKLLNHAASSASTLIMDESHLDLVRIGISLYGPWPSSLTRVSYLQLHQKVIELWPVLSWKTTVTTVKNVRAGSFIGYGCTYRAIRDMRIVVIPVGYFEGYPRIAGEGTSYVLIRGQRCPVVGRICMNMMMADVTHVTGVEYGEVVTLIGKDGLEQILANDLATWAKTINYEILSRLHPDIPRRLLPN